MTERTRKNASLPAIFLALCLLSSCGEGSAPSTDTTVPTDTTAPEDTRVYPNLPEKDFGGAEYVISTFSLWGDDYVFAEEQNGDVLNDAIFARNSAIEEKYNVKIRVDIYERQTVEVKNRVEQSVTAGDGAIDLAMTNCQDAARLMSGGFLMPLDDVPHLDLSKPWWDQRAVEDLSIGGELYFTMNSLNIMADNFSSAVFFNKGMLADYQLDDPYKLVDDNKWTWDKMLTMAKVASKDVDGDGEMTDKDTWGVLASYRMLGDGMANCGELIITKDKDDYPVLALSTSRSASVCEKLLTLLSDSKTVLPVDKYAGQYTDAWQDLMYPAFKSGHALFISRAYVQYVMYFRDSEVDYGILPRPKFDSAQDRYYTDINYAWASTVAVPRDVKDPEMAGIILEALAAESLYTVTPANYDVTIVNKQLRDEDSERMLDIIYANRCFDYGQFMSLSDMNNKFINMYKSGNFTFASDYAADKEAAGVKIADLIDVLKDLEK